METGSILILNGTSSAGKSTLLKALQATLPEIYLDAGLDKFIFMLPRPYLNQPSLWAEVMEPTRSGPVGLRLISGMHRAIAGLARSGNFVVADHVLIDPRWLADAAATFAPLRAYLIGVHCPLEVVEQREKDRGDRTLGQAGAQFHLVHAHGCYDFSVNTAEASPEECARQIEQFLAANPEPRAFRELRQRV